MGLEMLIWELERIRWEFWRLMWVFDRLPLPLLISQPYGSDPNFKSQPSSSNLSLKVKVPASRLKFQPQGSNSSLEAQIPALRLKFQSQSSNPCFKAQIPVLNHCLSYCHYNHYRQLQSQRGNGNR